MKRRSIILLVVFMTISVFGIRVMQVHLRENDEKLRNQQFSYTINQVLYNVATKAERQELDKYFKKFESSSASVKENKMYEFFYKKKNKLTDETFIYKHLVLEKDYNLKFPLSEKQFDSVFGKIVYSVKKSNYLKKNNLFRANKSRLDNSSFTKTNRQMLETTFKDISVLEPIYKRVSTDSLKNWIRKEIRRRNIDYNYEYGILNDGILTKVHSENFVPDDDDFQYYKLAIFPDDSRQTDFDLAVAFNKGELFKKETFKIQLLSDLLTIIILIIYVLTIYFIIRQKKISQMKTDFINNMTHEFKTPIATINLITDAMKSPSVITDEKQLKYYLQMLKQENKRMLSQVENIMSLSILDKLDANIDKTEVSVHEIIEGAILHVSLIIEDREGSLETDFKAVDDLVFGNEVLLTNVFVNILDNAIKYSEKSPEIKVKTYNKNERVYVEISDKGIGMSKSEQKKIFEKFYRISSGDIHNAKGHGLGLAYVQKIIKSHDGKISVKSAKNVGSTFTVSFMIHTNYNINN